MMVKHDIDYSYFRQKRLKLISDWAPPLAIFAGALALYIKTMAPSVFWGNMNAFTASSPILGPDSPSLFPLYTFLVNVISMLPGLSRAFHVNLMSAFFAAVSVMMVYLIVKRLSDIHIFQRNFRELPGYRKLAETNPNLDQIGKSIDIEAISKSALTSIPSFGASVLFGLTLPVWLTAVHAGVYSLFLALTLAGIFFAIEGARLDNQKWFLLGVWLYALTFACHPVAALAMAPAFLYLIIRQLRGSRPQSGIILAILSLFAISFSVYFYLPIHSSMEALQSAGGNGQNSTLSGGLALLSDLPATPGNSAVGEYLLRLKKIVLFIAGEVGWPVLALMILGSWGALKASKRLFPFFPLAILGSLALPIWIGRFNLQNYEMISFLAPLIGLIIIVTIVGLLYLIRMKLQAAPSSIYAMLFLCPLIYAAAHDNYPRADMSRSNGPEFVCEQILKDIPKGSLLIINHENLVHPLMYFAGFESGRPEISIIAANALHEIKYRRQLINHYPHLVFPEDFESIEIPHMDDMVLELCRLNSGRRDIFIQYGVPGIRHNLVRPSGVLFKYAPDSKQAKMDLYAYGRHLQLAEKAISGTPCEPVTVDIIGKWLFNTGHYYDQRGNKIIAWRLYDRAMTIDQSSTEMRVHLADDLARAGRYKKALKLISDALEIDADDPAIMEVGYRIAKELENKEKIAAAD